MRMRVLIAACLVVGGASANTFKLNYKNLNSLGGVICSLDESLVQGISQKPLIHKIEISKTKQNDSTTIEIDGTCNAEVDLKQKAITSSGNQFTLEFSSKKNGTITTDFGLSKLNISFKNGVPQKISLSNPFTKKSKIIELNRSAWAKNNSIFSLNKNVGIKIKHQNRVLASENNSNLVFKNMKFFNIWSFSSFACEAKVEIGESQCQKLADLI